MNAGLGVKAVVPADGVAGISVRTPIAIVFDGPIDPASVDGAIRITPPIGGDLRVVDPVSDAAQPSPSPGASGSAPGEPTGRSAGSILLFTPSNPLAQHTTYTVALAPVVERAGDPGQVAAGRTWTFTTGGETTSAQNQIAFLTARGGVRNVWLMNPDGSNPRQVTTELAPVSAYDVSSDGRSIAYAAGGVVRLLRLDGSDLATVTGDGQLDYAPTLAPGGEVVLLGRRDVAGTDLGWWLEPLPGASAGSQARQLIPYGAPPVGSVALTGDGLVVGPGVSPWADRAAFDPTGRWLLFVTADGRVIHADLATDRDGPTVAPLDLSSATGVPAWDATGRGVRRRRRGPHRHRPRPGRRHGRRPGGALPGRRSGRRRRTQRDRDARGRRTVTTSATRPSRTRPPDGPDERPRSARPNARLLPRRDDAAVQPGADRRSDAVGRDLAVRSGRTQSASAVDRRRRSALAAVSERSRRWGAAYLSSPDGFDPPLGRLIHSPAA